MVVVVLVAALLIVLLALIFAFANGVPVTVNFLFAQVPTQLSLAILISFVAGVAVGLLVMVPGTIMRSVTIARHRKRIDTLEKSVPASSPAPMPDDTPKA